MEVHRRYGRRPDSESLRHAHDGRRRHFPGRHRLLRHAGWLPVPDRGWQRARDRVRQKQHVQRPDRLRHCHPVQGYRRPCRWRARCGVCANRAEPSATRPVATGGVAIHPPAAAPGLATGCCSPSNTVAPASGLGRARAGPRLARSRRAAALATGKTTMSAALQERLDLLAIEGGVASFGSRRSAHAVALLDVVGAEAALASADDATQEELLAGRAQFLNAQTTPFQVVVRAEPIDLEGHLRRVQARLASMPEPLRAIALDYLGYLPALAQQRTLLERHCYVVLPDQRAEIPAVALSRRLRRLVGRGRHAEPPDDPEAVSASVARRLQARADLVTRQLGRSGLRTHRLDSRQIAELLHRCWSPELARVQRLRDELGAYTTLAVSARQPARARPADEPVPGTAASRPADEAADDEAERMFALGNRSLADLIAPSGCEVRADHLQ